jgi:hypothetical protein
MADLPHLWPRMQEKFFKDLTALHAKSGPWDVVLFTGDLTYQGSSEEFERLDKLLEKLWHLLGELGSTPLLLAVPGNHDLARPDPAQPELILLQEWASRPAIRADFWDNSSSPYRRVVKTAFQHYLAWWDRQRFKPPTVKPGMLPGDFSATLEKASAKLGIVGLNTTFLQLAGGDYEGKLALSARQFHAACGGDSGPEWAREHHVCLLLTHQPFQWLTDECQEEFNAEIADPGQFAAHLFGHMHEARYTVVSEGGGEPRSFWQGRSLFGLESFTGKAGREIERLHGYSVGKIELIDRDTASLTFWPREARRTQGGFWKLAPDYSYEVTDDGGTKPQPVRLLRSFGSTASDGRAAEDIVVVYSQGEQLLQSTANWEGREVSFRPLSKEE